MLLQCKRCIDLHGAPGCAATHESEDGAPSCVFCVDGVLCPVLRKREQVARKREKGLTAEKRAPDPTVNLRVRSRGSDTETKGKAKMETKPATTSQAHAPAAIRVCERPGCTTELGALNRSGRCAAHFHWKGTAKPRSNGSNGHAAAGSSGTNGHARTAPDDVGPKAGNESNGHGSRESIASIPELAADRVDRLILSLPVADKTRLAVAWLTGAI
jgi:hypothetical protein